MIKLYLLLLCSFMPGMARTPGSETFGKIAIPVLLQLTRTELTGSSPYTISETYRETWNLEVAPSGSLMVSSMRAKVSVSTPHNLDPWHLPPENLFISEFDLARLAGVGDELLAVRASQDKIDRAKSNMVLIGISKTPGKRLTTATLQWSDEVHISVSLEMGLIRPF